MPGKQKQEDISKMNEPITSYNDSKCIIRIAKFYFNLKFQSDGRISSNIANTLRGAFGAALRNVVCTFTNKSCNECVLSSKCAYGYIFETPIPDNTTVMRKYTFAPHPFIIIPPEKIDISISKGKLITIGITLIGKAIEYLPYVFVTLQELGSYGLGSSKVKFTVETVKTECDEEIYSSSNGILHDITYEKIFEINSGKSETGRFSLKFHTPLRIQIKGKISNSPSFNDIIASLCRRSSLLSYFHCNGDGNSISKYFMNKTNTVAMIDKKIVDVEKIRYSARQKRKVPMNGFQGKLTYEGDYGSFLPLLRAGEYIHLGKDTVFGYGRYTMEVHSKND